MGIHRFFPWFKNTFDKQIKYIIKDNKLRCIPETILDNDYIDIDNLMIDLNGIIHTSAQKIYEYGNYKCTNPRILKNRSNELLNLKYKENKVFEDVCDTINKIFLVVEPNKRLIICIDGPAPQSKQSQQRKRRFKSALENESTEYNSFDSNSITPGTKFMDNLSKYIDYYIHKMISIDEKWKDITVIFSNEKVPGEGEHKAISFVRNNKLKNPNESYCIHGLDSDLIMLTLGTHVDKFFILRDENYNHNYDYLLIDIGGVRKQLINMMNWEYDIVDFNDINKKYKFIDNCAINDFILICFLIGNDFLPQIPSIEILSGGINLILDLYRVVCKDYGHLTNEDINGNVKIYIKPMSILLFKVGEFEKDMMIEKITEKVFTDDILEKTKIYNQNTSKFDLDILKYKELYYNSKFSNNDLKEITHSYLEGMQWVLSYYTKGVTCWKWSYKFNYAPFALDIASNIDNYTHKIYPKSIPNTPFKQLLCVLSPFSYKLIPYPLCNLLIDPESPIIKYYPKQIEIDLSGKHKEYEGVVILPKIDINILENVYDNNINKVDFRDLKRNNFGKTFMYYKTINYINFKCYYGEINNCNVYIKFIDL